MNVLQAKCDRVMQGALCGASTGMTEELVALARTTTRKPRVYRRLCSEWELLQSYVPIKLPCFHELLDHLALVLAPARV